MKKIQECVNALCKGFCPTCACSPSRESDDDSGMGGDVTLNHALFWSEVSRASCSQQGLRIVSEEHLLGQGK